MKNTVTLRRDYLHYIKKYNRFEKRHHNLPAHLTPAFGRTRVGDIVTVGQTRPVSKTVNSALSESRSKELKVTLERPLSCSELIDAGTRHWSKMGCQCVEGSACSCAWDTL